MARELSAALGDDGARREAAKLVESLAVGIERDQPESLRRLVRESSRRWRGRGAEPSAVERALAALVLPRASGVEPEADGPWGTIERGQPVLDTAARLQRERIEKNKFAALLTVSHAVANSLELGTILATIAGQVREVIQTDECTVFLYDEQEKVLRPKVCDADSFRDEIMNVRLKLGEGITGTVAQSGRGEIVNDAERDPRAAQVPGTPEEHSSLLCVPLLAREKVVGVITLTRTSGRSFTWKTTSTRFGPAGVISVFTWSKKPIA